ncbi:hypothetical protein H2200_011300 [Cladophialophora chaetospira]|uniref:Uncharacterized protein n=1 Tax=Cladophialophora chaetospira TaxID=386627 RepID=A0AA38X0D3_9EURO|nr:hypothetical protein H2200_011300 [Cladophialophora chaetospira]
MMMVPRSFAANPLAQRQQQLDFSEKERDNFVKRKARGSRSGSPPTRSALSQSLLEERAAAFDKRSSEPVKIPSRPEPRILLNPRRPGPSSLQPPTSSPAALSLNVPRRKQSAQDILSCTNIPIRRKPKQRPSQRIPNVDYVADFSKLLRDDVSASNEGSLSGSWTNPQFEGLFGNIDGLVEGQMIVGSEGLDAGILSARSLSAESMPSLSSADDLSSISPATIRSPSEHRLRQMASSEDCSNEHPLLPMDEEDSFTGSSTPELTISPPSRMSRRPMPEQKHSSFRSSLTASLKALKFAAQTVSTIATTPPLVQPEDFLARSVFEFRPSLTDDRRPPPSSEPPSVALRRYLNPNTFVPPDSPAQLHFWVDEKPTPSQTAEAEARPKLKIKRKYKSQSTTPSPVNERAPFQSSKSSTSKLPALVPLATCIPGTIRTAHASSPPTWLEADGTPSNKFRAAQTLWADPEHGIDEGQPRPREPRENRDFLRVFVCEMNMRKNGKFADDAVGKAKLWLPPVEEGKGAGKDGGGDGRKKKAGRERWTGWTIDDL